MRGADGSADGRRALSGARQGLVGGGLLLLALAIWAARDFIPRLAMTRVVATAVVSTLHDGRGADVERAFALALKSRPTEATLEPETNPAIHGTYYLSVTADASEQARAGLAGFTKVLQAAFPSSERNLLVSPNNSTTPAPNDSSKRISFGVRVAVVLLLLGGQLLLVVGAHRRGLGRAGLLATIATPFLFGLFPADTYKRAHASHSDLALTYVDYKFVLLLLMVTPVSVIVSLWLTRRSHRRDSPKRFS